MKPRSTSLRKKLLDYLVRRHLVTLLTETEDEDHHEVYAPTWPVELGSAAGVVEQLKRLERDGLVERIERVHPFDTAEYLITWRLVGAERPMPGDKKQGGPKRNGAAARSTASRLRGRS